MIAVPPLLTGADHRRLTWRLPAVACRLVTGAGATDGSTRNGDSTQRPVPIEYHCDALSVVHAADVAYKFSVKDLLSSRSLTYCGSRDISRNEA